MELFNLIAKLVLDTKEYDRDVSRIQGQDIDGGDVTVGLDTSEYDAGVADVSEGSDTLGEHVGSVFEGIKTAIAAAGITAVLAGITNLLKDCVNKAASMGDEIDKGSKRMGITTRTYQVWNHVLGQSGGGITDISRGMKNLRAVLADSKEITEAEQKALEKLGIDTAGKTRAELKELATQAIAAANSEQEHADTIKVLNSLLGDGAEATGTQAEALKALGVSTRDANGQLKSSEKLLEETILALADMTDTNKRDNLVDVLFGPHSGGIKPMLDEGVEGIKRLIDETDELGLVMTDDEIKNAVAYGDAVANLQAELTAIQTAFVADIIPVLTTAVGWLTSFLEKLNPRLQTNSVYALFQEINTKTILASQNVDEATATTQKLIEDLQAMGDYWSLDEEGRMTWDALAEKALELFPQLSDYIDTDGKKIKGNTDQIMDNVKAWALLEKQRILSSAMDEKQKAVADQLTKAYEKGAEARKKEADADGKRVTAIQKLNDLLREQGMATLDLDASQEEVSRAQQELINSLPEDDPLQLKAGLVFKEYGEAWTEAAKLRSESEKMKEEANAAKDSLAEEQKYLMQEMGFTQEEIDALTTDLDAYIKKTKEVPSDVYTTFHTEYDDRGYDHSFATGADYIPYDNYPSLLHRSEMVLNATEARRYREGKGNGSVDLSGLKQEIVGAIKDGMADATVNSYLDGRQLTDEISRRMAADAAARRYG